MTGSPPYDARDVTTQPVPDAFVAECPYCDGLGCDDCEDAGAIIVSLPRRRAPLRLVEPPAAEFTVRRATWLWVVALCLLGWCAIVGFAMFVYAVLDTWWPF